MQILFITSTNIGDAILSTGVLNHLIEQYPSAEFTIAAGAKSLSLFEAVPRLQQLIPITKQPYKRHWLKLWQQCWGRRWGLIIDFRSSAVGLFLRKKKHYWHYPSNSKQWHRVKRNAALYQLAESPPLKLWVDKQHQQQSESYLHENSRVPLIAVAPAANWPCKMWPTKNFIELLKRLTAANSILPAAKIMVLAGTAEQEVVDQVCMAFPDEQSIQVVGESLLTAAACLKRCHLFVGNDSGLMHMAAAVGVPTFGLFGPSAEALYAPFGPYCAYVRTPESYEALMLKRDEYEKQGRSLMESLTVESVEKRVLEFWSGL